MGMKAWIEKFQDHLRVERNASIHTLRSYSADLDQFRNFLSARSPALGEGGDAEVEKIDSFAIRAFLSHLYRDHKKSSMGRKLAALRSFFQFLVAEGVLSQNPAEIVASPKQEKPLPNFMPVDETFALMDAPDAATVWGARDKAILETLYSTGMRVGELVGLSDGDFDFALGIVRVFGKGGKERIVPVGEKAESALRDYMRQRDALGLPGGGKEKKPPVFVNRRGGRLSLAKRGPHPAKAPDPRRSLAENQPPRPASFVCDAPSGCGGRSAGDSGASGTREPFHDPALHACKHGQTHGSIRPGAPPGEIKALLPQRAQSPQRKELTVSERRFFWFQ